jgi:hypothetical protein
MALDARPRPVADIERAHQALTGIYRDANEWAARYPEDAAGMPTANDALAGEAQRVLEEARARATRGR